VTSFVWQIRSRMQLVSDRPAVWLSLAAALLVSAAASALAIGRATAPIAELPGSILEATHPLHAVVWDVRLPRIACAAVVGMNLALAGALLQTTVRNPLADPGILGVTAGAGVGALVTILLWPERSALVPWSAFLGGLGAIVALSGLAFSRAGTPGALRIVLSGVALQAILFAITGLLTFLYADRAPSFTAFVVGSLNGTGWNDVARMLPPTLLTLLGVGSCLRNLDLLLLDDAAASGVGLNVLRARFVAACLAALLTAAAVSAAGLVGFVGLVVPNAMRLLVGPGHAALLPLSALAGAALVVLADTIARAAFAPIELPVGALLALVGGPYFLFLLWRKLP